MGGELNTASAFTTIYWLGVAACQPVWAEISHSMGRKPVLLTGLAIYIGGSVFTAASSNNRHLYAARALQGIGG
jgi:MFS transporter, DHA1 family, multidrug resistance protein